MKYLKNRQTNHRSAVKLIEAGISRLVKPRPLKTIHASAITHGENEYCPRMHVLAEQLDRPGPEEYIGASQGLTFDMGYWVQSQINNVYMVDNMVGDWKCMACNQTKTFSKKPDDCEQNCNCNWQYEEMRFTHSPSGAAGGFDGLISWGDGSLLTLLEVKIIRPEDFKDLAAPLAEHRRRTKLYLRIIKESGSPFAAYIDTTRAIIVYVCRTWGFKIRGHMTPVREFEILADDNDPVVKGDLAKAHAVTVARRTGYLPMRVCQDDKSSRASKCHMREACFGNSNADIDWRPEPRDGAKIIVTDREVAYADDVPRH